MSSDDVVISVANVSKCYFIYEKPVDRLKQFFLPRLKSALRIPSKNYNKEFWALNGVSFNIKKGETVGIIGKNGSGKSTLLHMICGTLTPTHGSIKVKGRVAALLELGSGFNLEFSGRENIYMYASVLGLKNEDISSRLPDIIEFADIGDFIDQPVKTYSSGMVVRLAFSVMAHVDADILVIDEALAVGDVFFTQKCMRFIRDFMKVGTVLFVSHDTNSIKSLCNSVIWINDGEVVKKGAPKEVCELYIESFYQPYQSTNKTTFLRPSQKSKDEAQLKDQRLQFLNLTNLRNDIRVFDFDPYSASFGSGGAEILNVELSDFLDGHPLLWIVGGEKVVLRVLVSANQDIESPIVGFFVKDKLGQILFGDNTYLYYIDQSINRVSGEQFSVDFSFEMPNLPSGDYSITVAAASGTQEKHEQLHWIHDAVIFKSQSSSVSTGIIGIPMLKVEFNDLAKGGENV